MYSSDVEESFTYLIDQANESAANVHVDTATWHARLAARALVTYSHYALPVVNSEAPSDQIFYVDKSASLALLTRGHAAHFFAERESFDAFLAAFDKDATLREHKHNTTLESCSGARAFDTLFRALDRRIVSSLFLDLNSTPMSELALPLLRDALARRKAESALSVFCDTSVLPVLADAPEPLVAKYRLLMRATVTKWRGFFVVSRDDSCWRVVTDRHRAQEATNDSQSLEPLTGEELLNLLPADCALRLNEDTPIQLDMSSDTAKFLL